ncbi:MAG: hypothetical protein EBR86_04305 [Planctomycetia bacterium]|nr:hypothetical protein [Planctomycetia bacterium]
MGRAFTHEDPVWITELGAAPLQPGGHGDSRRAAPENEDSMVVWHGMVLWGDASLCRPIAITRVTLEARQNN